MQAWTTPPDREGTTWRIEAGDRVRVLRRVGARYVRAQELSGVDALAGWLVERGIDPADLTPA